MMCFFTAIFSDNNTSQIITKERTKDGLNKKSTFCALLIQDIFGFSELNKVASCMGILLIYLYSIFPINE